MALDHAQGGRARADDDGEEVSDDRVELDTRSSRDMAWHDEERTRVPDDDDGHVLRDHASAQAEHDAQTEMKGRSVCTRTMYECNRLRASTLLESTLHEH